MTDLLKRLLIVSTVFAVLPAFVATESNALGFSKSKKGGKSKKSKKQKATHTCETITCPGNMCRTDKRGGEKCATKSKLKRSRF